MPLCKLFLQGFHIHAAAGVLGTYHVFILANPLTSPSPIIRLGGVAEIIWDNIMYMYVCTLCVDIGYSRV